MRSLVFYFVLTNWLFLLFLEKKLQLHFYSEYTNMFQASKLDQINMTEMRIEYDRNWQTLSVRTWPKNDNDER